MASSPAGISRGLAETPIRRSGIRVSRRLYCDAGCFQHPGERRAGLWKETRMSESSVPCGGAFLIEEATPEQVLIPEELSAESRLIGKTMEDFLRKEVQPLLDRLETQEEGLMR